jgi:hypothetical protein
MALAQEDLDAIKTIVKTTVQASEHRLKNEMARRFDQVDKGMDNIVQEIVKAMGDLHEDHEERIKGLEREMHLP